MRTHCKTLKILALFVALTTVAAAFSACSDKAEKPVSLSPGGKVSVAVVRPSGDPDEDPAAVTLFNFAREILGRDAVSLISDRKPEDGNVAEIVVGSTTRAASTAVRRGLRSGEFAITVKDGSIVVAGGCAEATLRAAQYFVENCGDALRAGVFSPDDGFFSRIDYPVSEVRLGGVDLADYVIVCPETNENTLEYAQAQALRDGFAEASGICPRITDEALEGERTIEILPAGGRYYEWTLEVGSGSASFRAGGLWGALEAARELSARAEDGIIEIAKGETLSGDTPPAAPERDFDYVDELAAAAENGAFDPPVKKLTLCGADVSEYTIVHGDPNVTDVPKNEIHAADELSDYIYYATGVRLGVVADTDPRREREIVLGVAAGEAEGLGDEGYEITADNEKIYIRGGEKRGTLYGVYAFLREFAGCEFFASDCEVIYRADSREVPAGTKRRVVPDLEYRDVYAADALSGDIAAKLNINGYYLRSFSAGEGGCVSFAGGNGWFVHTVTRCIGIGSHISTQPCFSDPDNLTRAIEQVRGILEKNPGSNIVSVTQNDNDNYCRCAECSRVNREEGSTGGAQMRFINAIADAIREDFPDARILTLAYMYSEEPPATPPRDNVIVELCPIGLCSAHSFGECAENSDFPELLDRWKQKTGNVYVWTYVADFEDGWKNTPFMNFDAVYGDVLLLRQKGVKGIFNEGLGAEYGTEFAELRTFLLSRLMWEPDMTRDRYDDLTGRFIDAYYGEASGVISRYFDLMQDLAQGKHFGLFSPPDQLIDSGAFRAVRTECAQWLNAAADLCGTPREAAGWSERQRTYRLQGRPLHVSRLRDGFEYLYGYFK